MSAACTRQGFTDASQPPELGDTIESNSGVRIASTSLKGVGRPIAQFDALFELSAEFFGRFALWGFPANAYSFIELKVVLWCTIRSSRTKSFDARPVTCA